MTSKITVATGIHHQMQVRPFYFFETTNEQGERMMPNKDFGFIRSQHFDIEYNISLTDQWRFKTEVYYQLLSHIPVKDSKDQIYSLINLGAYNHIDREENLITTGTGRNYGVELTLEKFFSNSYYLLLTTTLYNSTFRTGVNNKTYNTAFNGNYIATLSGGYEWRLSREHAIAADLRATYAGGQRYVAVDEAASVAAHHVVYDYSTAFEHQLPDYFRADVKLTYRMSFARWYQEWALDLQNVTNHSNVYTRNFRPSTGKYFNTYQQGFMPMVTYKVMF